MAENTKIAWTDHTFNPWMGCQKWSKGCDHCYADTLTSGRMGLDVFGGRSKRKRTSVQLWNRTLKWNREAGESGKPARVFCASLADVFEDAPGPNEWRPDVWEIIRDCPWLDFQLLTKRPENVEEMLPEDWGAGYPNVWLGTSIEDRDVVFRAQVLAAVPAIIHFVSYEPAIGPVFYDAGKPGVWHGWSDQADPLDLPELNLDGIEWLICGGESGPGYRHMDLAWAQEARRRCADASVAFFFKQDSAPRTEQGIDALGEVVREFPLAWNRAELVAA
jgi:protein gp37